MHLVDHPRLGLLVGLIVGGIGLVAVSQVSRWAFILWGLAGLIVIATAIQWLLRKLRVEIRRLPKDSSRGGVNPPGSVPTATGSPGQAKLRADLAANLEAVREFRAEYDKIMGPQQDASSSQEDAISADLFRLATNRLGEIPLRPYETLIVVHILRDAIQSLDTLPFTGIQPGNAAADVKPTGKRRQCTHPDSGEQMWHLPTKFHGLGQGIILSDQTLDTLTDLHGLLMKLRREVYDRYHPPTLVH